MGCYGLNEGCFRTSTPWDFEKKEEFYISMIFNSSGITGWLRNEDIIRHVNHVNRTYQTTALSELNVWLFFQ